jgi:hypothetical protein
MRFLIVFLALAFTSADANECPFQALLEKRETIIHPCTLKISGKLGSGKEYSFEMEEAVLERASTASEFDGSYWGADGGYPCTYINKLSLIVNSQKIWIPRKSFTDIGNISSVEIAENGLNILIEMNGGDAAGSFHIIYTIQDNKLVERMVTASEAPDQVWEKSIFHNSL